MTFKKLLQIATGGRFLLRGELCCNYNCNYAVTMGTTFGPTLAYLFLAHLENQFMTQRDIFIPVHYPTCVDEIFCVFISIEYVEMSLGFLNNLHPNMKFSCEVGPHNLTFLDTQISLSSNNDLCIITNVHRKPTDTKTILNFHAVRPWIWKSGLIRCFFNREFIVCSNWFAFHEEISNLKDTFHMIGYHKEISYNHEKNFLSEKLMNNNSCQNMNDEKKYTVIIPFIGHPSLIFKISITKK